MCQPLQASCTSSYLALPIKLLLSSCFLLCFILAAQKHLGHWRNVPCTLPLEIWSFLTHMKPFQGGFSTMVSIPKLCVPASRQHAGASGAPAFLRDTDSNVASMQLWENPTMPCWQRDHWEHVEPYLRCCLSWKEHLNTSSPQPTTVVTLSSRRLKADECSPARTPVYTHPCSLGSGLRNAAGITCSCQEGAAVDAPAEQV